MHACAAVMLLLTAGPVSPTADTAVRSLCLNGSDWKLTGYWRHQWRMRGPDDQGFGLTPPPVPATVPGAVHADLLRAGVIPYWQDGLNARLCEWVDHRDWSLKRSVTVPDDFTGRLTLECDGLDYSGTVLIDRREIATFEGTHLRHRFDLTGRIRPGQTFELEFIFDAAPEVDGQIGYTVRTHVFKPRFGYYWDWCPRIVNVGIWQDIRLVSRGPAAFERCRILPRVDDDLQSARIRIAGAVDGAPATLRYALRDEKGAIVTSGEQDVRAPSVALEIPVRPVKLWWPATHGMQPLYHLTLELLDAGGQVSDTLERTVGFKRVRWLPNPGASDDAQPYLCEINGRLVHVRGVNWVPLSPLYGTVRPERYEAVLRLYRNMNANLLRVWGGAILETPAFYDACDRLGLLVWQEFPLSSSGINNWPPEEPEVIEQLVRIAAEYIERRAHHACHLLWCGGNELLGGLDGGKVGIGRPVDESHPVMKRWQQLIDEQDPGKRFLTSSPSGPRFAADAADFGKGIHHDIHGPWGNLPLADRYGYWNGDDSLFRSETGAPGCASLAALERHRGDQALWPPRVTNPYWLTPGALWTPWADVIREFGPVPDEPPQLPFVVKASRYLQAESYRYAAEAARRRFPGCGGFLIWMGHDCVPCTANNSVIEVDGSTKPAFDWLQRTWAGRHVSLRHNSICYAAGERIRAEAWIHRDDNAGEATGTLTANLRTFDGRIVETLSAPVRGTGQGFRAATLDWPAPDCPERLFIVELTWTDGPDTVANRYLLSQQKDHPLAPLRTLPPAQLTASQDDGKTVTVRNTGKTAAIGVRLLCTAADRVLLTDVNHLVLLPGESQTVHFELVPTASPAQPLVQPSLQIECFNNAGPLTVTAEE